MTSTMPAVLRHIVIVGASLAGMSAARSLRAEGFAGHITVIGEEVHRPYDRPPLSKQHLGGTGGASDLGSDDISDVRWVLGSPAISLNVTERSVELADGQRITYDGLIIATGAAPRQLPGYDRVAIYSIRTIDDADAFRDALTAGAHRVALVGAGFIGAEIASTCVSLGVPVTIVENLPVPFSRTLGPAVGAELARLYTQRGVDLRSGRSVTSVLGDTAVTGLTLDDGSVVETDLVVVSVGVVPSTGWLHNSGLPLDNGVVCDETLQVAPGIVAAGDVARWPNARLGEFRRVEHWENAITSGEHAARTLLGQAAPYSNVPWVWSDQFGFKLQFIGSSIDHDEVLLDSTLDTEGRLLALYRKGDTLLGACGIRRNKVVLSLRDRVGIPGSWQQAREQFVALTPAS